MMICDEKQAEKAKNIINEAISEALSSSTHRTYREIWVDMTGEIMELFNIGASQEWKKEKPEFQDKVGELTEFTFEQFLNDIAKIESAICRVLALEGEQQIPN